MQIGRNREMYMTRGDSEYFLVAIKDYGFQSGDVVTFTVRRHKGLGDVKIQKVVTEFDDLKKAHIVIDPEDTAQMDFDTYYYDIQVDLHDIGRKTIVPPTKFVLGEECTYG